MGDLKCCAPPMARRKRDFSWVWVFAVGAAAVPWDVLRPQAFRQINGEATEKGQPPCLELFKSEAICPWRSCSGGERASSLPLVHTSGSRGTQGGGDVLRKPLLF
jgi:hypothetical protein